MRAALARVALLCLAGGCVAGETKENAIDSVSAQQPASAPIQAMTVGAASAQDPPWKAHVDWEWFNNGIPTDDPAMGCAHNSVVNGRGGYVRRGATTPHQAVVNAIQAARAGDYVYATNWLVAAQCHNPQNGAIIAAGGRAPVDYAIRAWGSQVPGGPPPDAGPGTPGGILTYRNDTGRELFVYEGLIPLGTNLDCDARGMRFVRSLPDRTTYTSAPAPRGSVLWVRIQENQRGACDSSFNRYEGHANPPS
jgi:hypothetical protein